MPASSASPAPTTPVPMNHHSTPRATVASRYNVARLPRRLATDLTCAFAASSLVAPLVTLLDKSIVLRTHSAQPLRSIFSASLGQALRHPLTFLVSTPYLLIHGLYASTYLAANVTDTWSSTRHGELPVAYIGSGLDKFLVTGAVNMSVCLYKDTCFARLFGASNGGSAAAATASASRAAVSRASLALFASRDALTIFASFNAPSLLAPWLGGSIRAAQFAAPATVQLLSTPLHLLGLDLFNRPQGSRSTNVFAPNLGHRLGAVRWKDRWQIVKRDWLGASLARMGRIVPAYGVGGVVNRELRTKLMRGLES